jgi:hypothetical protein
MPAHPASTGSHSNVGEPAHTVAANLDVFPTELAPYLFDAVHPEVLTVYPGDLDLQLLVTLCSS